MGVGQVADIIVAQSNIHASMEAMDRGECSHILSDLDQFSYQLAITGRIVSLCMELSDSGMACSIQSDIIHDDPTCLTSSSLCLDVHLCTYATDCI